jgi:hypothetical protein
VSQANWALRSVPFKFMLSDRVLMAPAVKLQVRQVGLSSGVTPVRDPQVPDDQLLPGSEGFLIRSLPVEEELPLLATSNGFTRYVPSQFSRYYIDLGQSFEAYQQKFSSRTRSTIKRKVRKFEQHTGGKLEWKTYRSPEELREFIPLARQVSALTYQERLLDAGLPDDEQFAADTEAKASQGRVRAFLLFHGSKPVAYLFCPVQNEVLLYQYLGYDPTYAQWSVGTVLQWLALEELFGEGRFRFFDFTEGESEHKRLFGTDSVRCANVFFIKRSLRNTALIRSQMFFSTVSEKSGDALERYGLKARVRKLLRGIR